MVSKNVAVPLLALSLILGACGKGQGSNSSNAAPSSSSSTTAKLPPSLSKGDAIQVANAYDQPIDAVQGLPAPNGASATVVLGKNDSGAIPEVDVYVVDSNRKVLYAFPSAGETSDDASTYPKLQTDKSGNVLAALPFGNHAGRIVALRVTRDGVDDFGSKPANDQEGGAFASDSPSQIKDVDGDGVDEIVVSSNDYTPDYASGTDYFSTYKWDGAKYSVNNCAKSKAGGPTTTFAPANGKCAVKS